MVPFSACLAVLLPFLALVVEPALLSPDREVVFSLLYFTMYCPDIYVFYVCSPHSLWVFTGYSFMGTGDWVS